MGKRIFLFVCLLVCSVAIVQGQISRLHAGVIFPSGDFGDEAAIGVNAGYKYYSPLSVPGLHVGFSIDLFFNTMHPDEKDKIEKYFNGYDITHTKFINIPAMALINYTLELNETVSLFGDFGMGLNFSQPTPDKYKNKDYDRELKSTYTLGVNFCLGLEGGIILQDKYTIGLRYNQLGTYKYKYKETDKYRGNKETDKGKTDKFPVSNLILAFGVRF